MKPVYTWRLIYILLFCLPSHLSAQPKSSACFLLKSCIGAPILKAKIFNHAEANDPQDVCPGELVSIDGQYGLIKQEAASGHFDIIISFKPLVYTHRAQAEIVRFQPRLILKQLALMERLSNN
jgi:hypothetical protein